MKITIDNFEQHIPSIIVNRGKRYFLNEQVISAKFKEETNTLYSIVQGSFDYFVEVSFDKGAIVDFSCTCPYANTTQICKHIVASFFHVKSNKLLFEDVHGRKSNLKSDNEIKNDLIQATLEFHQEPRFDNDLRYFQQNFSVLSLKNILRSYKLEDIYPVFISLEDKIPNENLKDYIEIYNDTYNLGRNNIPEILKKLQTSSDSLTKKYFYYSLIKNHIPLNDLDYYNNEFIKYLIITFEDSNKFIKLFRISNMDCFDKIKKYIETNHQESKVIKFFLNAIDLPTIERFLLLETLVDVETIRLFIKHPSFVNIPLDLALYLNEKYDRSLNVETLKLSYNQIVDNIELFKNNLTDVMITYLENVITSRSSNIALKKIDALKLLRLFDENYNYSTIDHVENLAIIHNLVDVDRLFKIKNEGLPQFYKNNYHFNEFYKNFEYTNYQYIIRPNLFSTSENIVVFNSNDDYILTIVANLNYEELSYKNDYHYSIKPEDVINELLYRDISRETSNAFDEFYAKEEVQRKIRNETMIKTKSKNLVFELSSLLMNQPEVILENKVTAQPIISFDDHFNKNDKILRTNENITVGLKVGNDQLYFVKNISNFFNYINEQTFQQYGKRLAFDHNIKSFTSNSQKIIDVLEKNQGYDYYKNNLGVNLSPRRFKELFTYLLGKQIVLYNLTPKEDYEQYDVLNDPYKVLVKVSEDSFDVNLINDLNKYQVKLLKTPYLDLIINVNSKTIGVVNYSSNKIRTLVDFLLDNKEFDTSYVIDDLIKTVIPLIKQEVKLDSSLEGKIEEFAFKADSYFDYDETIDAIKVESNFFEGDKPLAKEELEQHKIYLTNYRNVLKGFNFNEYNLITKQEHIVNFLNADLTPIKEIGNIFVSDVLTNMKIKKLSQVSVNVSLEQNILKTHIESVDLSNQDLSKVLEAYKQGKKYIKLNDNVILTDDEAIKELALFMELNELDFKDIQDGYEKPIYEVFKFEGNDSLELNIEDKLIDVISSIINYKDLEVTEDVKLYDVLKPYQQEGYKWLKTLSNHQLGGILADDMGLGKTLQMITFLENEEFDLSIVICPKSLIYNWANEMIKFNASFKHLVYSGLKDERIVLMDKIVNSKEKTLIITSYDTLRNDIEEFKALQFDTVILDEAQNIKTVNALRTKAVKELNANKRFVLTGTPIENSVYDLWSIFDFILPGYLYEYNKFTKIGSKVHEDDVDTLDFLIKKIQPFILRRIKKDVLKQLPEKQEEVLYATFDGKNRDVYDAYLKDVQNKLVDGPIGGVEILKDLMRLRQLCISPKLVYDNYEDEQLKIEVAKDLINEAISSGHKVLVFSSFVQALELVKENYKDEESYILTGKTPAEERIAMSNEFNKEEATQKVFFISLKAGGTGLNLVGADIVIHLDPWWNVAAENQASDRAHRIGQQNVVTVYKIVMKDSIEERIIELQNKKRDLFDKMIDHDQEISKMTLDDYKFILS